MTVPLLPPPPNVSYGRVTAQFVSDVRDNTAGAVADVDQLPDWVALAGKVTFTASVSKLLNAAQKQVIGRAPVVGVLDSEGYLCTPAKDGTPAYRGVELVATDDPDLNPTGWTWTVTYALSNPATSLQLSGFASHPLAVLTGETIDLSQVIPPDAAQAVGIPQAEALAAQAVAASETAAEAAAAAAAALTSVVLVRKADGTLVTAKVVVLTLTEDETDIQDIAVYDSLDEVGA